MRYEEVVPISRSEAEVVIRQGDPEVIIRTLIRLAYHEPDWRWVQNTCLELSSHSEERVRGICATCLGHLARIHGQIDMAKVMPVLRRLLEEPELRGIAEDAIDDLQMFIK